MLRISLLLCFFVLTFAGPLRSEGGALITLIKEAKLDDALLMISKGKGINERGKANITPLMVATYYGYEDLVRALIDQGADIDARNDDLSFPLLEAVKRGHLKIAKILVDEGARINMYDKNKQSPLIFAAMKGYSDVADYLLQNGAVPEFFDKKRKNSYFYARAANNPKVLKRLKKYNNYATEFLVSIKKGDIETVRRLLKKFPNANIRFFNGASALMLASYFGHLDIVKLLLDYDARIIALNPNWSSTALMEAASQGHLDVSKFLVENKADLRVKDKLGRDALYFARANGHDELAAFLEEALLNRKKKPVRPLAKKDDFDLDSRDENGLTRLMIAARGGDLIQVEALVNSGADPKKRDKRLQTALMYGVKNRHLDVTKVLVEISGNLNLRNKDKESVLHLALKTGNLELVKLLVRHGSNINQLNGKNRSPVFLTAFTGFEPALSFFVERGANVNIKDKYGNTPLMAAVFKSHNRLASLLIANDAALDAQNNPGKTALMIAAAKKNKEIVMALLKNGADPAIKDKKGADALSIAKNKKHMEIARIIEDYLRRKQLLAKKLKLELEIENPAKLPADLIFKEKHLEQDQWLGLSKDEWLIIGAGAGAILLGFGIYALSADDSKSADSQGLENGIDDNTGIDISVPLGMSQ